MTKTTAVNTSEPTSTTPAQDAFQSRPFAEQPLQPEHTAPDIRPQHTTAQPVGHHFGNIPVFPPTPPITHDTLGDHAAEAMEDTTPADHDTGLPAPLKDELEATSGYALDDVTVHYNSPKPARLDMRAYAQGTEIHLGPGQEHHLPEETKHVLQQKQGRVQPNMEWKGQPVCADHELEREAQGGGSVASIGAVDGWQPLGTVPTSSGQFAGNGTTTVIQPRWRNTPMSNIYRWHESIDGKVWYRIGKDSGRNTQYAFGTPIINLDNKRTEKEWRNFYDYWRVMDEFRSEGGQGNDEPQQQPAPQPQPPVPPIQQPQGGMALDVHAPDVSDDEKQIILDDDIADGGHNDDQKQDPSDYDNPALAQPSFAEFQQQLQQQIQQQIQAPSFPQFPPFQPQPVQSQPVQPIQQLEGSGRVPKTNDLAFRQNLTAGNIAYGGGIPFQLPQQPRLNSNASSSSHNDDPYSQMGQISLTYEEDKDGSDSEFKEEPFNITNYRNDDYARSSKNINTILKDDENFQENVQILSGHGVYAPQALRDTNQPPTVQIPPNTTFTMWLPHGSTLRDWIGGQIDVANNFDNLIDFYQQKDYQMYVYTTDDEVYNYHLLPGVGLKIQSGSNNNTFNADNVYVLQDLLTRFQGQNIHWAACAEIKSFGYKKFEPYMNKRVEQKSADESKQMSLNDMKEHSSNWIDPAPYSTSEAIENVKTEAARQLLIQRIDKWVVLLKKLHEEESPLWGSVTDTKLRIGDDRQELYRQIRQTHSDWEETKEVVAVEEEWLERSNRQRQSAVEEYKDINIAKFLVDPSPFDIEKITQQSSTAKSSKWQDYNVEALRKGTPKKVKMQNNDDDDLDDFANFDPDMEYMFDDE